MSMKKILTYFIAAAITSFLLTSCSPVKELFGGVNKYEYGREVTDALIDAINAHDFSIIEPYFCDYVRNENLGLEERFEEMYDYIEFIGLELPITEDDIDRVQSGVMGEHSEYNVGHEDVLWIEPDVYVSRNETRVTYLIVAAYMKYPNPDMIGVLGFIIRDVTKAQVTKNDKDIFQFTVGMTKVGSSVNSQSNYPPTETVPDDYWDFMR